MRTVSHHPRRSLTSAVLAHAIVVAVFVAVAPHCLFGCAMPAAPATVVVSAPMDCCGSGCPMEHAGTCMSGDEETAQQPAVVKSPESPLVEPMLLASAVATPIAPAGATFSVADVDASPSPPSVPFHLLNSQFLI